MLAVGTNDTKYENVTSPWRQGPNTSFNRFGPGQIYVFGNKRIGVTLSIQRKASIKVLQFCADKLLCFDSRNDLSVFSLETKKLISSYSPPGTVTALCSDPMLDYAFLGMQSGRYYCRLMSFDH